MYTNVLVEHMVRQKEREINQFVAEQQMLKEVRARRARNEQENGLRRLAKNLMAFLAQRNRPVACEDCAA